MNEPMVITMDTIRELRQRGKSMEAMETLWAYRNDVKNTGKQASSDVNRKDRRIRKHLGICVYCKRNAMRGSFYCDVCYKNRKEYDKQRRME